MVPRVLWPGTALRCLQTGGGLVHGVVVLGVAWHRDALLADRGGLVHGVEVLGEAWHRAALLADRGRLGTWCRSARCGMAPQIESGGLQGSRRAARHPKSSLSVCVSDRKATWLSSGPPTRARASDRKATGPDQNVSCMCVSDRNATWPSSGPPDPRTRVRSKGDMAIWAHA